MSRWVGRKYADRWMRLGNLSALAGLGLVAACGIAMAAPSGETVVGGQASISRSGATTTINQSSDRAVIDWRGGFNVSAGEAVNFNQPGASSITLNRVKKAGASSINGDISAPGKVWIVNPDGVVVGADARISVGGFLATTADISNENFLAGNFAFDHPSTNDAAAIVNRGIIIVGPDGHVVLAGPRVVNGGTVQGTLSSVVLGGVPQFRIDLDGDGLIQFEATGTLQDSLENKPLVTNTGSISVEGGTILLTVDAAFQLVTTTINTTGLIEAHSTDVADGKIILSGGSSGHVKIAGEIRAVDDAGATGQATVEVNGLHVLISNMLQATDGVTIDAKHIRTEGDGLIHTATLDLGSDARQNHAVGGEVDVRTSVDTLSVGRDAPANTSFDGITVSNDRDLVVDGIEAKHVSVTVDGDLTIIRPVTATGGGDAVVLVADRFINQAGPGGISTPNGRSLIYSVDPRRDDRGGLPGVIVYNGSISSTPPSNINLPGNVFIYELPSAPTVPATPPPPQQPSGTTSAPQPPPQVVMPVTLGQYAYLPTQYQYSQGSTAGGSADKAVVGPGGLVEVVPVPVENTETDILYANGGNLDLWDLSGGE